VDPHIYPEQPGCSPDSGKSEDSVNYLRQLKVEFGEPAPADALPSGHGRAPGPTEVFESDERRKSPRLHCSGSAEILAEGSDVRMWGTLTDVSLHGCYLEMSGVFPVDTIVELVLKSCGIRIHAQGRVRASYPALGMGICITEIEPGQQAQLKQLLALLAGHGTASVGGSAQENRLKDADFVKETLRLADPGAFLAEITTFFQKSHLLSRDEFYQIAKQVRRS